MPLSVDGNQTGSSQPPDVTIKLLPSRYSVKESPNGLYLTCVEAPNLTVRIKFGWSVSSGRARRYPKGTIFLDGAARGRPFLDSRRRIYNLDHHEGCIRSLTLATCEQAMVLILKGLDLRAGDWTIYANDPDLDVVIAIWLLLNHTRINDDGSQVKQQIMPLVRLQGVIDAHGLELMDLSGFSQEEQQRWLAVIEDLRQQELSLKKEKKWSSTDHLAYVEHVLRAIDEIVYTARDFEQLGVVDELARVEIEGERTAIVCRSDHGIYDVEKRLRKLLGDRLGLIVLQQGPSVYTVRIVDPFLPITLDAVYTRLNQLDAAVDADSSWGGSGDIGGSPRARGSMLDPGDIAGICDWAFHPPSARQRLATTLRLVVGAGLVLAAAILLTFRGWPGASIPGALALAGADTAAFLFATIALIAGGLLALGTRFRGRVSFGTRLPIGRGWLLLCLPPALIAAVAGGSWAPLHLIVEQRSLGLAGLLVPLLGAVAAELLFRGIVHGYLVDKFHVQRPGGDWFLSVPNVLAAVMYAVAAVILLVAPIWSLPGSWKLLQVAHWLAAIFILSLACGVARERTGSLIASVIIHGLAATAAWFLVPAIFG
jgi:membrane protease YdiL (CAAX protease family)